MFVDMVEKIATTKQFSHFCLLFSEVIRILYFFWNRLIILWKKNMEIGNY
jgi:hypothetical protein